MATTIAVLSAAAGTSDAPAGWVGAGAAVAVSVTLVRTVWPLSSRGRSAPIELGFELTIMSLAAVATGGFDSPLAFTLIAPIAVCGFIWGTLPAAGLAAATTVAVGTPGLIDDGNAAHRISLQWAAELLLVGIVAGYANRLARDSAARQQAAQSTVDRLADTNHLLLTLHDVTQELPASLDLDDALAAVLEHVRTLVPMNYGAIALQDDAGDVWRIAAQTGRVAPVDGVDVRIADIRRRLDTCALVSSDAGPLFPNMSDVRYLGLRARDELIGVLAVEHNTAHLYDRHHEDALVLVAESAALAIDNARLFQRIRVLELSEERARIARDIHDRMGQSLAYMGFELERITRGTDESTATDLTALRSYLREVTGEVRETLHDLRSDVHEAGTAREVLEDFTARVEARSGMTCTLDITPCPTLSRIRERELCRITREALVAAERQSRTTRAHVRWNPTADGVEASITSDGCSSNDSDPSAISSMRQRAAAIGGHLSVDDESGDGRTVRITIPAEAALTTKRVPA